MNDANRAALAVAFAERPWPATRFELLPIRGMQEAAGALPTGAVVTVTCSPRHGLERTLEASEWLAQAGFRVVPHLAARLVRDRRHLARLLARLAALGVEDAFVVGGDAERPVGDFPHGRALLEAMAVLSTRPARVGVPAYPEGHRHIEAAPLQADLEAKAVLADYAVTQLCFEAEPLLAWRARQHGLGLSLPVHAGIPGVMERQRLVGIALRLGLGPSVRALRRQGGWISHVFGPPVYRPDALLRDLWPTLDAVRGDFVGLHVYTFNQTGALRTWRESLSEAAPGQSGCSDPSAPSATSAEPSD